MRTPEPGQRPWSSFSPDRIGLKSYRRPGDGVSAHVTGCVPEHLASKVRPSLTRDSSRMPRRGARAGQRRHSRHARGLPAAYLAEESRLIALQVQASGSLAGEAAKRARHFHRRAGDRDDRPQKRHAAHRGCPASARAFSCPTSGCPSTTRISRARPSPTCSPIRRRSRARPSPTQGP
jgi:hypothetical protein